MSDGTPMIDLNGLTKPATVLIERLSDLVGGGAQAQADKARR